MKKLKALDMIVPTEVKRKLYTASAILEITVSEAAELIIDRAATNFFEGNFNVPKGFIRGGEKERIQIRLRQDVFKLFDKLSKTTGVTKIAIIVEGSKWLYVRVQQQRPDLIKTLKELRLAIEE